MPGSALPSAIVARERIRPWGFGPVGALALTLLAATCSGEPAAFYDPTSGAIAQCDISDLYPFADQFIATYQKAGWEKLTGPVSHRATPPAVMPQ